jgi:hypothetical protein
LLPSIAVGYEDIENSSQVVMGSSFYTPLVVHDFILRFLLEVPVLFRERMLPGNRRFYETC